MNYATRQSQLCMEISSCTNSLRNAHTLQPQRYWRTWIVMWNPVMTFTNSPAAVSSNQLLYLMTKPAWIRFLSLSIISRNNYGLVLKKRVLQTNRSHLGSPKISTRPAWIKVSTICISISEIFLHKSPASKNATNLTVYRQIVNYPRNI